VSDPKLKCRFAAWYSRVARCHKFKPEIAIWVNFGGSCDGRRWFFLTFGLIIRLFSILYAHLVYFVVIWYIFPCFGMFYQENLATMWNSITRIPVFTFLSRQLYKCTVSGANPTKLDSCREVHTTNYK
jgi:hypothetical protein